MSRILFAAKHVKTVLRMSRPLFVGSYLQVCGGLSANGKEDKNASNDNTSYSSERIFQSVSGHSSEQSTAHFSSKGQMYRSSKVTPTLFQIDLRITDHGGHKFSPSLTLLSVQISNRMASRFTTIASFPSVFLQLLQCSRRHPSSSAHWAALMTKTDLTFPAFSVRFRSSLLLSL